MEIRFQNEHQVKIAEILWEAQDQASVNLVLEVFGHDALVVYHMMIAATMDQVTNTDIAEKFLGKFRS